MIVRRYNVGTTGGFSAFVTSVAKVSVFGSS